MTSTTNLTGSNGQIHMKAMKAYFSARTGEL
jgi:hypothetical protein